MRRRAFMAGMGAVLVASDATGQQPGKVPRIGWLGDTFPGAATPIVDLFKLGLREMGYIVGHNVLLEIRSPGGEATRLPKFATELTKASVDVIVAATETAAQAARAATKDIPIVFVLVDDPVRSGLVQNLARPAGNITGITTMYGDFAEKLFDLLQEVVPRLSSVGLLIVQPQGGFQSSPTFDRLNAAAAAHRATLRIWELNAVEGVDAAFAEMRRDGVKAVIVWPTALLFTHASRFAEAALKNRLATITSVWAPTRAGILMAYMPSYAELFRRAGVLVGRILSGASPGGLPVEQPTKFDFVINLTTAKALGLVIRPSLLLRADHVIE